MALRLDYGIFTAEEDSQITAAVAAAETEVTRLEDVAAKSSAYPGWFFPTDEQRTASAARATLNAIKGVQAGVAAAPDYDHETALKIVSNAQALAVPGSTQAAIIGQTVGDKMPDLATLLSTVKWIVIGGGVLYALTIFGPGIKAAGRVASSATAGYGSYHRRRRRRR